MFMVFKKKQMIMTALVLMLGIAGYLNYRYDVPETSESAVVQNTEPSEPGVGETVMVSAKPKEETKKETKKDQEEDFMVLKRLERDTARAKVCEELKKALETEGISAQLREETESKLSDILEYQEQEATAQNLLSAKGFEETLVYITNESVTVNVRQNGLSRSDTAKIVDIIYELTQNNNIKIVEVK